jgi:chemotaxis protein MotB
MDQNHHSGPNSERWLLSYADFITLLFAVFVVLFASAQSDKGAARRVSEAVVQAMQSGVLNMIWREAPVKPGLKVDPKAPASSVAAAVRPESVAELLPSLKTVSDHLRVEIQKGAIEVRLEPRGLVITLRQAVFFASGKADVDPASLHMVDKVAEIIKLVPNPVRLEGHTDAVPISNSHYPSNWELSAARSIAMMHVFSNRNGIPASRLSIAGFADTMPLDANDDANGRARNRRVDVVILNQTVVAGTVTPVKKK